MDTNRNHRVARLMDEANKLGALSDKVIWDLLRVLDLEPSDTLLMELVQDALEPYRVRNIVAHDCLRGYPGFDTRLDQGVIEIGTIHETGTPWRVPLNELPHILIVGPTRKGKSYLIYVLLQGLAGKLPFLLVTVKTDAARLIVDPPILKRAYNFGELKLSLFLPPPNVEEKIWHRTVIELFCKTYELQYSRVLLHEACDNLRKSFNNYSSKKGIKATFTPFNLLETLRGKKSKYSDGPQAALDIFCRVTGNVFEYSMGYELDKLFVGNSAMLAIPYLTDERVARFVLEWLMEWLHLYFVHNGPNDDTPQLLLCLDDAHRILSKTNERNMLMPISHRYLIARQSGLIIASVSQAPSDLADAVLSQSGLVIQVGGLSHENDLRTMAGAMGIPFNEKDRLQSIGKAEFVARENLERYDRAFGGMVSHFAGPSFPFTESDRRALMAPILNSLPFHPAISLSQVEHELNPVGAGVVPASVPSGISPDAEELARDVLAHPWDCLSERYKRLGIAGRKAQKAKDELLDKGWVKQHKVSRGRGASMTLLEPLSPLCSALQRPIPNWGKGKYLHAFLQHVVVSKLKRTGHTRVRTEKVFGQKSVDVVATTPSGILIAIECAVHLSNVTKNIADNFHFQPNFKSVTTVCLSAKDKMEIKRMIATAPTLKHFMKRIKVGCVAEWL